MIDEEELLRQKRRRRSYWKLNVMSLFFTAVSFISVTLAWFAYSGLVTTQTEVNVKAWYIEFNNKGQAVSNNIVISLDDIYPGMDLMNETIDIKNSGDSPANIGYVIKSVRILDDVYDVTDQSSIEDKIAHDYPFHINMSLSDTYADANDGKGKFSVSVSWPLDSDDDVKDTEWGNLAYNFQKSEADKQEADSSYQIRSAIEVVISLEATQYINEGDASDPDYKLGSIQLYDPVSNSVCASVEGNCLKTYVIDKNNKVSDSSVTLLPDLYSDLPSGTYNEFSSLYSTATSGWTVTNRSLRVQDMLYVVSNDVESTTMVSDAMSLQLVGYLGNDSRVNSKITQAIKYNGYFRYKNELFTYFSSSNCYWLSNEYNTDKHFAFVKVDDLFSKIYGENKSSTCRVIPVMEVSKQKFNVESSS